jgi:hypothetical protein
MSDEAEQHSSRWRDFWDKTLPVIAGGLMAIAGSYLATTFQMNAQSRAEKTAQQRKVFATLIGEKFAWEQINVSQVNAATAVYYYQERWKRAGSPNTSPDLDETKYYARRRDDLVLERAKDAQAVLENIGNVQALFPDTPHLGELCDRIYTFKSITINTPGSPDTGSLDDLSKWKDQVDQEVQVRAHNEYAKPIDDLLAYLRTQLPH